VILLGIALLCAGADFALSAHGPLDLLDEGFLWYGVRHTALGEVPLRDFQAYDPARYYWGALWVRLAGDSIVAMRLSAFVLEFAMLALALAVLRRRVRSWAALAAAAAAMAAWAHFPEKASGYLVSVAVVAAGMVLLERPAPRSYLLAGACAGVAAFVGRNHGLYALLVFVLLSALLWATRRGAAPARSAGAFAAGVALGYAPMLAMLAGVPGFAAAFADDLRLRVAAGAANLPRPVPWPWRFDFAAMGPLTAWRTLAVGAGFLLLVAVPVAGAVLLARRGRAADPESAPLAAAVVTTAVYAHYAFSRPDLVHLAEAAQPLVRAGLLLPTALSAPWARRAGAAVAGGVVGLSALAVLSLHPFAERLRHPDDHRRVEILGSTLWTPAAEAEEIAAVRRAVAALARPGEGVFLAPHRPGLYLAVDRPSPVKTLYFLGVKDEPDRRLIEGLEARRMAVALITTTAIDGRAASTLPVRHPALYRYLNRRFHRLPPADWGLPPYYEVYARRPRG
jgi:hypothetical protein